MGAPTLTLTIGTCQLCGALMELRHDPALPRNAVASLYALETLKHLAAAHTTTKEGVQTGPYNELERAMTMLTAYFALSFVFTGDAGLVEQRRRLGEIIPETFRKISVRIAKEHLTPLGPKADNSGH